MEFTGPVKPLAAGPAEIQLFDTDFGPTEVAAAPITEVIRIQLKDGAASVAVVKDSWKVLVKAMSSDVPVAGGTSRNLSDLVFMGTIGWESLQV